MYILRLTLTVTLTWAILSLALPSPPNRHAGTKVFRIPTGNQNQTDLISNLIDALGIPAWTTARRPYSHIDVQVPKETLDDFHKALKGISPKLDEQLVTMHKDLGQSILKEAEGIHTPRVDQFAGLANEAWFNNYHIYDDHLTFLNDLAAAFPNNAKIVTSGTSYQNRTITGINIFGSSGSGAKPAVIFHGTVHAREWITTMVTEQIAFSLLSNYTTSPTVKNYVDEHDFYIFPVVNPDGEAEGDSPENKGVTAFMNARANSDAGAKLYVDWHSYGLYFMGPYGYSCSTYPVDINEHTRLEEGFAAAFQAPYGKVLTTGPICSTLYKVSGSSVDYAYDVSKIKYSFASELRGGSSGSGFILPPSEIRPSGVEAYEGVKYLLANMA
ncbi:hypothetical protein FRC10_006618 [Ceratobasidium sp. 414]|nr:hypothetical protein FRC10_006618 [Ceratobasidium sp. 414]